MIKRPLLLIIIFSFTHHVFSQSIMNAELNATPLAINPAFTGMFDGSVRVSSLYSNNWASVTVPYISFGASVDMPVYTDSKGNYLAAGILFHKDDAGDGNIADFNAGISLAYHKLFGKAHHNSDLAIGIQAGYNQGNIYLLPLYLGNPVNYVYFFPGTGQPYNLGNSINYYDANVGISFSHGSNKFNYTLGASVNNINDPNQSIDKIANGSGLLDLRYIGEIGANWILTKRLTLRPQIFYQTQSGNKYLIAGNEFRYNISKDPLRYNATTIFISGWYQPDYLVTVAVGLELKRFRIGIAYDYPVNTINNASNGDGGLTVSLKYIAPGHKSGNQRGITPGTVF